MIELPKRPVWKGSGKEAFEKDEEVEYQKWMKYVAAFPKDRINYYEHNIEVWRQLWRVCERSDVLFMLTDAR